MAKPLIFDICERCEEDITNFYRSVMKVSPQDQKYRGYVARWKPAGVGTEKTD